MFQIRQATEEDIPGIYAIFSDAVRNSMAIWIEDPGTIEDRRAWLLLRRSQDYPVFVAVEDGSVLGYGTLGDFRPYEGFRGAAEHSLYVAPEAQRRGIGRALLTALIAAAQELGKRILVAAVDADNTASIALHLSFGFVETGRMPAVGEKFGRRLDMVLLQRAL